MRGLHSLQQKYCEIELYLSHDFGNHFFHSKHENKTTSIFQISNYNVVMTCEGFNSLSDLLNQNDLCDLNDLRSLSGLKNP